MRKFLLTLPFLVLFYVQLAHHALWRDELNAFGIAVASPRLSTLFHYIHYEGHPYLWYVLLWIVSKFTVYPIGMKVLEGVIGTGTLLMIGLRSPFKTPQTVLLFLSYFVTFEYTVISRMYGVMLLLLFVYLDQRSRAPQRVWLNTVLLGLMAATDVMGIILSSALAVEYGLSFLQARKFRPFISAALIYLLLVAASLLSLKLTPDISWRTTGQPLGNAHSFGYFHYVAVSYVALPYLPVLTWHLHQFWNPTPWRFRGLTNAMTLFVLVTYVWTFRRNLNLAIMLFMVVIGSVLFGHFIYHGSERHFGVTFLAFVAGLWMLARRGQRLPRAAVLLLAFCALGGVLANVEEWRRPWSNAGNVAKWLQTTGQANVPIAGTADTSIASIGEIMHRETYQLECNCSDTFLLFSKRRDAFLDSEVPSRLLLARQTLGEHMLFIENVPLNQEQQEQMRALGLNVQLTKSFTGAEENLENFWIYTVNYLPGAGQPRGAL